MPTLRDELVRWTERFSDLAVSAEERYRDGTELYALGSLRGAVYSVGLAAEMWLKLASYRRFGAVASDPVGPFAARVKQFMQARAPAVDRESGHSLRFWAEFIQLHLASRGMPLSRSRAGQLKHHAMNRLYLDWKIELRYRPVLVKPDHARRVLADASWLRANWDALER